MSEAIGEYARPLDRLENNLETGDTVVDVIGFSRGAALAVSFANELAGKLPRVSIRFMGLWDVVGQFGAPGRRFNAGHDLGMPPNVMRCYHAMALDETRLAVPADAAVRDRFRHRPPARSLVSRCARRRRRRQRESRSQLDFVELVVRERAPRRPPHQPTVNGRELRRQQVASADQPTRCRCRTTAERSCRPICLHASVRLDPGVVGRPHNNPRIPLARIDDVGSDRGSWWRDYDATAGRLLDDPGPRRRCAFAA